MGRYTALQRLANELAQKKGWLVVDFETTGVDVRAEIVQVAVVNHAGTIAYQSLVRPQQPIPPAATRVHGLTTEHVAGAPPWPDVFEDLYPLLHNARTLAYNADFEARLLSQTCLRHGLAQPHPGWTCLMRLVTGHHGRRRFISLRTAAEMAGIPVDDVALHSAAGDALLTYRLLMSHATEGAMHVSKKLPSDRREANAQPRETHARQQTD